MMKLFLNLNSNTNNARVKKFVKNYFYKFFSLNNSIIKIKINLKIY